MQETYAGSMNYTCVRRRVILTFKLCVHQITHGRLIGALYEAGRNPSKEEQTTNISPVPQLTYGVLSRVLRDSVNRKYHMTGASP